MRIKDNILEWWFVNVVLYRINKEKKRLPVILINRMLRKYRTPWQNVIHFFNPVSKVGVSFDFVAKNANIGDIPWYQYYTMTRKEADKFAEWAKEKIKRVYPFTYGYEYSMFDVAFGLKISNNE